MNYLNLLLITYIQVCLLIPFVWNSCLSVDISDNIKTYNNEKYNNIKLIKHILINLLDIVKHCLDIHRLTGYIF